MPSTSSPEQVTLLLRKWSSGDDHALDELVPLVYLHLRDLARSFLRSERAGHALQTTELVNEAYLRLLTQGGKDWQNRGHFFAVAARVMRNILVDYARQHQRKKRGGGTSIVSLDTELVALPGQPEPLLALDQALLRMVGEYPRACRVVEMHSFGGLGLAEIADVLEISENTVQRDWKFAKAWLHRELNG